MGQSKWMARITQNHYDDAYFYTLALSPDSRVRGPISMLDP